VLLNPLLNIDFTQQALSYPFLMLTNRITFVSCLENHSLAYVEFPASP